MTPIEQIARGDEAQRLLDHPLVKEFFDKAEQAIVKTWMESEVTDEAGHKMCKLALRAQQNLRQQFEMCVRNGEVARRQLLAQRDETKPVRRAYG
jgi:hypothetical protein